MIPFFEIKQYEFMANAKIKNYAIFVENHIQSSLIRHTKSTKLFDSIFS